MPLGEISVSQFVSAISNIQRDLTLSQLVGKVSLNLFARPIDPLASNIANLFVASLKCLALFVSRLRQLHHDVLAITAVFGVELHNGVSSGGGAGEEV